MTSSAGWKSSRTRPRQQPARRAPRPSARAAPTRAAVWTSWPQAWATPVDGAGPRVVGQVLDRQRVEVGAQRDERARGRRGRRPARCAGSRVTRQPACSTRGATSVGGARLAPGQLGVGVQVAAQVDEVGVVLVDDGVDDDQGRWRRVGHRGPKQLHRRAATAATAGTTSPSAVGRYAAEDPVGGDRGRQLAGEHGRRGPRRGSRAATSASGAAAASSSSRTSAQVKSSCWRARLSASPASPRCSRCASTRSQRSSTPTSSQRRAGDHRRRPLPLAAHQPQRAGELAGGGAGLLLAVAVGLVDRDHVGDLEDALLDALQLVAGAGQGEEQERVDHARRR